MKFFKFAFRQPYLDADDGTTIAGATTDLGGNIDAPPPQEPPADPPSPAVEKIKIKYNHEDMEIPYEEAVNHIQKGMNYEKGIERAKQEARDAYIAEQNYEWNGKPITTEAEYKTALEEAERQKEIKDKGLDPDEYKKFVDEDPIVREAREWKENQSKEMQRRADSQDFLGLFEEFNGRAWKPESDVLPQEVIEQANKGKSLADAYARYYAKQFKTEKEKVKLEIEQDTIRKINQNAISSPGSASGSVVHTTKPVSEMTAEEFAIHREEVSKRQRG